MGWAGPPCCILSGPLVNRVAILFRIAGDRATSASMTLEWSANAMLIRKSFPQKPTNLPDAGTPSYAQWCQTIAYIMQQRVDHQDSIRLLELYHEHLSPVVDSATLPFLQTHILLGVVRLDILRAALGRRADLGNVLPLMGEDDVGEPVGRSGNDHGDGPDAAVHVGDADGDASVAADLAYETGKNGGNTMGSAYEIYH